MPNDSVSAARGNFPAHRLSVQGMLLSRSLRVGAALVCVSLAMIACASPSPVAMVALPALASNQHVSERPAAHPVAPLGALIAIRPNSSSAFSGSLIDWDYVYDRNALRSSELVGSYLVAIAEAGHLLVFDCATLQLVAEALAPDPVKCIGAPTDHDVLVGFSDGRIARVSIPDFGLEELESGVSPYGSARFRAPARSSPRMRRTPFQWSPSSMDG